MMDTVLTVPTVITEDTTPETAVTEDVPVVENVQETTIITQTVPVVAEADTGINYLLIISLCGMVVAVCTIGIVLLRKKV